MVKEVNLKFLNKDYLNKKIIATIDIFLVHESYKSIESTIELQLDESLLFEENKNIINENILNKLKLLSLI